jgi:hypothetical protein
LNYKLFNNNITFLITVGKACTGCHVTPFNSFHDTIKGNSCDNESYQELHTVQLS